MFGDVKVSFLGNSDKFIDDGFEKGYDDISELVYKIKKLLIK